MTNVNVFQVLATEDAEEQERLTGNRAVIAAQTRVKAQFGKYVANARGNEEDFQGRIAMLDDRIRAIATEACEDYGFEDTDKVYLAATFALGGGHKSDCSCGFCENMGKGFGPFDDESPVDSDKGDEDAEREDEDDFEKAARVACACGCGGKCAGKCECGDGDCSCSTKESSVKTAEFETGYQSETVNLPSADASGLGGPSPKIDKGTAGGQSAIDVGSVRNKLDVQDLTENGNFDYTDAAVDPTSPLRKTIDADKPLQPEFNVAPNTKTFGDQKNQADPVTSSVKLDNWLVVT